MAERAVTLGVYVCRPAHLLAAEGREVQQLHVRGAAQIRPAVEAEWV